MPIVIWLSLSFCVGLISLPVVAFCLANACKQLVWYAWFLFGISQAPWVYEPPAWKIRRYAAGIVGLCVLVILFSVAVGEAFFDERSFNVEKTFESELYIHVAVAFMVGLLVALHQTKLRDSFGAAIRNLKDGDTIPWQTQVAGIVFLALAALIAVEPEILNRLASFKAGEVEAHFTEASSSTIKEGPIVFSDFGHKEILQDWSDFDMINLPRHGEEENNQERELIYKDMGANRERLEISKAIFAARLKPLFQISACFQRIGLIDVVRNDIEFKTFVELYGELIKDSERRPLLTLTEQDDRITKLRAIEDKALAELTKRLDGLKAATGRVPPDECSSGPTDRFATGALVDVDFARIPEEMLWDPYIIAPIADLIAFVDDQSARAAFLNEVSGPLLDPKEPCDSDENCSGLTPGTINLLYSNVDAKVKSHWTWPLEPQIKYLDKALDGIEQIISRSGRSRKDCLADERKPRCAITPYFLKSKFVELSLGLELYYRHALSGEILDKHNLLQWQFWLDDMQRILDVLLGIHPVKLTPFVDEYATDWRDAAKDIQKGDGGGLIADAESGTAIGIILLARQTGTPKPDDCLAAEALATHLLNHQFPSMVDRHQLDPSQLEAYEGLIIQFDNRIRAECPTR